MEVRSSISEPPECLGIVPLVFFCSRWCASQMFINGFSFWDSGFNPCGLISTSSHQADLRKLKLLAIKSGTRLLRHSITELMLSMMILLNGF